MDPVVSEKIEQLKVELRLERQNKFATNKQKAQSADATATEKEKLVAKRGSPQGHPGWYRKAPTQYDVRVDVAQHRTPDRRRSPAKNQDRPHRRDRHRDRKNGELNILRFL